MPTPQITVGIPFLNEERRLGAAIRSILEQTFEDFELIAVDDGSTDRSVDIVRSFQDSRIRLISDGQRRFLPARLNQIVAEARAPIVARMDADDVSHPERLAAQYELLQREELDAVGCWVGLIDYSNTVFAVVEAHVESLTPFDVLERGVLPHPTLLATREWFVRFPYDERLSRTEDRDLWCRSASSTRFGVVPKPLYAYSVDFREKAFVSTYLETARQNRTLYRKRGPTMVGYRRTLLALLRSVAKSVTVRDAAELGLLDILIRRRGRSPNPSELSLLEEALETASS